MVSIWTWGRGLQTTCFPWEEIWSQLHLLSTKTTSVEGVYRACAKWFFNSFRLEWQGLSQMLTNSCDKDLLIHQLWAFALSISLVRRSMLEGPDWLIFTLGGILASSLPYIMVLFFYLFVLFCETGSYFVILTAMELCVDQADLKLPDIYLLLSLKF